ncbi:hypothetical protein [Pseudofulvibacter geojedonensis]|uniref:Lipoprotein n=1 Tax=Pseudofulvibacter geojedonensis TaxID=1123758 RepID=A0ABW3I316_9FLAO
MKNIIYLILIICLTSCAQNSSNKTDYGLYLTPEVKEYMNANNVEFTPLEKDIIRLTMEQYEFNVQWWEINLKHNNDIKIRDRKKALMTYAYQKNIITGDPLTSSYIIEKFVSKFEKTRTQEGAMKSLFDYAVKEKNWAKKSLDEIKTQYNIK